VCSWCQEVALSDLTWASVDLAVQKLGLLETETFPRLTHGMCEFCRSNWNKDVRNPVIRWAVIRVWLPPAWPEGMANFTWDR
jgi:hypothetical protein